MGLFLPESEQTPQTLRNSHQQIPFFKTFLTLGEVENEICKIPDQGYSRTLNLLVRGWNTFFRPRNTYCEKIILSVAKIT
jgi:hypothetical protein